MRNWGLINGVAHMHKVSLLSFHEGTGVHPTLAATCECVVTVPMPRRTWRKRLTTLVTSPIPDMGWRLWSPVFDQRLKQLLAEHHFDIVQVEGIELARYLPNLRARPQSGSSRGDPHIVKWIFDDHNCEYILQQRNHERDRGNPRRWHASAYSLVQWQRLKMFERRAMCSADATLCVSPEDQLALIRLDGAQHPVIIPNGIDVVGYESFAPATRADPLKPPTLVFSGKMDYRPNIEAALWFGAHVLPRIQHSVPDVRWILAGQKPDPRLDVLRANPAIEITGAVDDIRDYIARADVYVAPLLAGGGTRFKLLEAMSMRKPIVSTTVGAEGFAVTNGEQLLLADSAEAFAACVIDLLRNPQRRAALAERGLELVKSKFDWSTIVPQLEDVYTSVMT